MEAIRRLEYGIKPLPKVRHVLHERLSPSLATLGLWQGVRLQFGFEGEQLTVNVLPQVGFAHNNNREFTYITEPELNRLVALPDHVNPKAGIKIIGPKDEDLERLISILATKGIPFKRLANLPPPPIEDGQLLVETRFHIDSIVKRCIAKIAFNYTAYVTRKSDKNFILNDSFNSLRFFIRYGQHPGYKLIIQDGTPILFDDLTDFRQTNGHLMTVDWTPDKRHIVGQVSFFNEIRYRISLARDFSGIWREVQSGHHFDPLARRISPLGAASQTALILRSS